MEKGIPKSRVNKEKEKINKVTHWDLDYLPKEKVQDLYEPNPVQHHMKEELRHSSGISKNKLSLMMIAGGLFLLAVSLYIASLI